VRDWKNICQANGSRKQGGVAIFTSDKVDFKLTLVKRDKQGHFILTKGAKHQEEITILNLYEPNVSTHYFIKHTLNDLKSHINAITMAVRDFNAP
jgi:hypothetical protein